MKKEIIFGIIGSLIVIGLVIWYSGQYQKKQIVKPQPDTSSTSAEPSYTQEKIAEHNRASDCWLIINNGVYDVTAYLEKHPSGPNQIIPLCGKDATTAFNTKNGRGSHSTNAAQTLNNFKIGTVKSQ